MFFRNNKNSGFTLVELLVVVSVTALITISLLSNLARTKLNIKEVARIIVSDIRTAQANSLASKQFSGIHRCGYGLHMLTASQGTSLEPFPLTYYMYTTKSSPPNCPNLNYQPSDADVVISRVLDERLELCAPSLGPDNCGATGNFARFEDIFFITPRGQTVINKRTCPVDSANSFSQILVRKKGATCPSASECAYICIYASGKIESQSVPCVGQAC